MDEQEWWTSIDEPTISDWTIVQHHLLECGEGHSDSAVDQERRQRWIRLRMLRRSIIVERIIRKARERIHGVNQTAWMQLG